VFDQSNTAFLDRDPRVYPTIMEYLRGNTLDLDRVSSKAVKTLKCVLYRCCICNFQFWQRFCHLGLYLWDVDCMVRIECDYLELKDLGDLVDKHLHWMERGDEFQGLQQIPGTHLYLAVSKSNTFDPEFDYGYSVVLLQTVCSKYADAALCRYSRQWFFEV